MGLRLRSRLRRKVGHVLVGNRNTGIILRKTEGKIVTNPI